NALKMALHIAYLRTSNRSGLTSRIYTATTLRTTRIFLILLITFIVRIIRIAIKMIWNPVTITVRKPVIIIVIIGIIVILMFCLQRKTITVLTFMVSIAGKEIMY